ncbi:MAG: methyltransferase domain-containing protein [Acidimicrobiia bacterium]|nr:methyltransferase domain-containing protein [Acidimicrobiia bacterium]
MTALLLLALFQVQHQSHPPRSAAEYAKVLENPARDAWQKPHEVIQALALKPQEAVADIGAGSGYFARRIAHHAAKLYAVDIDPKLLEMIRGANIETVLATHDDPKLPDASVDTIFICDVLHHIASRPAYYAKLAKALKPGGRIVIIDFYKKQLPVGPPVSMKLSEDEVKAEFEAAGFHIARSHDFLPHQYFLEFQRR